MRKLTDEQIAAIKTDMRPLKIIAYEYNISDAYAQRIRGSKEILKYFELEKRIKELEYRVKILEKKNDQKAFD